MNKNKLTAKQIDELLNAISVRYSKNINLIGIAWPTILKKLQTSPDKLWSLNEMERTGGEPNVIEYNKKTNEFIFCDCSAESPTGRRSLCYDRAALDARKENKPKDDAFSMASAMGIELLSEEQYRFLQTFGKFDTKTSSWIHTPDAIRKLGGALFCDFRYGQVFTYHNGAESYYAARGFRGLLKV